MLQYRDSISQRLEETLKRILFLFLATLTGLTAVISSGCATESAQTQALYTDAKTMWDEMNRAFTLVGKSPERVELMNKIITEEWDVKIVEKLDQYLKDAPSGKYAKEAKELLAQARSSDRLRRLGQVRPLLQQQGIPKTPAEAESVQIRLRQQQLQQQQAKSDSAKPATPGGR